MRYNYLIKKSFTLLEMLIVLVILGILASAIIPRIISSQSRSRDARRKVDANNIHNALSIAKEDQGRYPRPIGCGSDNGVCYTFSVGQGTVWISGLVNILNPLPVDPLNNGTSPWSNTGNYSYAYGNTNFIGKSYTLLEKLETQTDVDRCEIQDYRMYIAGGILSCKNNPSGCGTFCNYLYVRADTNGY